jgi:DNA-binding NarL/FixJ family response regulator
LNVLWWEASAAHADGDLAAYRRLLEEWSSWTPTPTALHLKVGDLADLALEEGRLADARALLEVPTPASEPAHHPRITDPFTRLALAALDRDRPLGRVAFDALVDRGIHEDSWSVLFLVLDTVMHALAIGISPSEIRERIVDGMFARHPAREQVAARVEGLLLLAEGRPAEAAVALGRALVDADTTLPRPVAGSLYLAHAQALLAAGNREGATQAAQRAAEALGRWPGWRRDRADALVARLEGSAARPIGELTARESEVATLLAEGLTNGQLAERLFISPKTAAVHVSNILAKLSLTNRAEIAAWAVRQNLRVAG